MRWIYKCVKNGNNNILLILELIRNRDNAIS